MKNRNIITVDADTGEILPNGKLVYVTDKARIKEGWFMTFQDALLSIAKDKELNGQPTKVLLALLAQLDFENYIYITQAAIAKQLGIDKSNVSNAMKKLTERKIILRGPKVGAAQTYRLNNFYAWKGDVRNLQKARADHIKLAVNNNREKQQRPTL